MKPFDRRSFTRGLAAAGVTAAAGPGFAATSWGRADLVVIGGTIYSMDPARPQPEAFAVRGNRILAVGSADDMRKLADFVLLGGDPHTAEPDRIKDIPVLRTVMNGRTTFEA